jgi:hypothetical protein
LKFAEDGDELEQYTIYYITTNKSVYILALDKGPCKSQNSLYRSPFSTEPMKLWVVISYIVEGY